MCPTTGTYSEEYRFRCLARHVCRIIGKEARALWITEFSKRNGIMAGAALKKQVEAEWPTRNQPIQEDYANV